MDYVTTTYNGILQAIKVTVNVQMNFRKLKYQA